MIDYSLDSSRRIAVTRVTGRFTFAELANHLHRLVRDRRFHADFDSLIVATDSGAVPPRSAIGTLAPLARAWSSRRKGSRWAFVLPSVETRAFAETALAEVRLTEVTVCCFCEEAEARAWLQSSRAVMRSRSAVGA